MTNSDLHLLGIVLCGGQSKRMGRDKAELKTRSGMTFLDHAYQRLIECCGAVCLSGSNPRETRYMRIADPPESYGPISGLYASLDFAMVQGYDAVVFTPVDTPFLTVDDIGKLVDAFRADPGNVVCAINESNVTTSIEPLIAVYPASFATIILHALRQSQYSLQRVLAAQAITRVPLSAIACRNINTPSDLQHFTDDE